MGLQGFERRLERLVEGTFAKAFRSGLQPVEIARRMVRELDANRTIGVRGMVAPNHVTVWLCDEDYEHFESFSDTLVRELEDAAREHAREERYHFLGPVRVEIGVGERLRKGDFQVEAAIEEGVHGRAGSLVLGDGRRIPLDEGVATIGRLSDCTVPLPDPQVSRRHAEIRAEAEGYVLHDLGSLNGTTVNGQPVSQRLLEDGDAIGVGAA
ncbi:MAG: FHA domain-containing protein, partial [Actinobacteria bacterium]|nr:FHA domain-containing protein [Actinomycetota bacterium]